MKNSSKILSLFLSTLLISSTANADFSDVNGKTEYRDSILWMKENNIINGYGDGSFKPNNCVNRAEFLKMLFKTLEIDSTKSKGELFPDTPESEWYAPYIRTAREHKTINGYADGKFRPNNCVSRAEAIKMAEFEFNSGKIPEEPNSPMLTYAKDVTEDKWYYGHIGYALQSDIVGLDHATIDKSTDLGVILFHPEKEMSRKEVAEMLYRIKTIKDNSQEVYNNSHKPKPLMNKSAEVNITIDQILLTSVDSTNTSYLSGNNFEFDVYLERTDLKLKEEKNETNLLTVDLPLALQPKLMYMSDI